MTRKLIALIGLALLVGCSGGGDSSSTTSPSPPPASPLAQPDMLTLTPAGLLRGKASGQGQHLVFAHANLQRETVLVSEGHVVYSRTQGPTSPDIWNVRADGTEDHALVNTQADEHLRAFNGLWIIYTKLIFHPQGTVTEEQWNLRRDTGAQFLLVDGSSPVHMQFYGADRILFTEDHQIFSETLTGTGRIPHTDYMGSDFMLGNARIVDNALIYYRDDISGQQVGSPVRLFSVPLAGGNPLALDSDQFYIGNAPSIGNRVVYPRCTWPSGTLCDVASIRADGTDRVVLASHPANEAVQGVTTNHVIIRRNLNGNDHLSAVPVNGGVEKLLMTMTDSEFVETIVGDVVIVRRPSGTWTLDLNGALKQLGTVALDFNVTAVGNAVCGNTRNAVWCMPLDGSGPQVKIADNGRVVGVL